MIFKILFLGEHTNHDLGDSYQINPLTASVAVLSDGTTNVLFDTGNLYSQSRVIDGLKELDLSPDDITHVLLTHFHLDHTGNCILFKNAEVHANRSMIDHKTGVATIFKKDSDRNLPFNIKLVPTPGHTPDHVSYFFEFEGIRYCMAGDAIREDLIESGGPHYLPSDRKKEFLNSMLYIFENSDIIIPGHFELIEGNTKSDYHQKLLSI